MVEGGFAYGYLHVSQNIFAQNTFYALFQKIKPARVLEIGTMHGGLTLMLRDIMDDLNLVDSPIWTYDINEQEFLKPLIHNRNIKVFTENLFNDSYTDFANDHSKQFISSFIEQQGTTVVLCDGGCKKCEFNLMAPLLKNNDLIMAHDYAPNQEYFDNHIKNKIWDWLEIQDNDILDSINKNHLYPYDQELVQKAAWCCRIKQL